MLFNSFDFAIFLPVVFTIYWLLQRGKLPFQNFFVVAASYVFYGWWDWRFLGLIFLSSIIDYFVAIGLQKKESPQSRKILLAITLVSNLGMLGFFKYFNFFIENFENAFHFFGQPIQISTLNIILPVGISFYTFQTLSYTIDVYRRKLEPTNDVIAFLAYVSFFPQLVAGPIERAQHLLPQFYQKRTFSYPLAIDGLRQILWGLFKKIVIADQAAVFVNDIFNQSAEMPGSMLVLGVIFFAFQIYGDFSGYSDIAIGTARLFGFSLMQNFAFPYFSRDIAEFWRRWHISLSTWFRDYLYIPLGGSKGSKWHQIRNTLIIFLVSGFWHGANWTFIVWGLINALYFIPLLLANRNRRHLDTAGSHRWIPGWKDAAKILLTFAMTCFAWIFFRANDLEQAFDYIGGIFSPSLFEIPKLEGAYAFTLLAFIGMEWYGRHSKYALEKIGLEWYKPIRLSFYLGLALFILLQSGEKQSFIYFQF
ncbi:MAG: MBOAT family protein [Bacteroidales bacterium]|nr:MBOAT family protein [Bacteroidales bacterium]